MDSENLIKVHIVFKEAYDIRKFPVPAWVRTHVFEKNVIHFGCEVAFVKVDESGIKITRSRSRLENQLQVTDLSEAFFPMDAIAFFDSDRTIKAWKVPA